MTTDIPREAFFFFAEVDEGEGDEKRLNAALINEYDKWIRSTR